MRTLILLSILISNYSFAAAPSLDSLTEVEAKAIGKEFSANFVHTNVAPASSLGDVFGIEIGAILGATDSPEIERISKEFDSTASITAIPHAGLIGAISIPYGITGELSLIPEKTLSDVTFEHVSFGLKWTFTNSIKLPFDIALRAHGSSSTLSYSDVVNNSSTGDNDVNTTVSYETSSYGANLSASVNLLFIEPYIGAGYVQTETDINVAASTTVSIFDFSAADSFTAENSGTHLFAGVNLNMFLIKMGLEMSQIMDLSRYTFKLSAYF